MRHLRERDAVPTTTRTTIPALVFAEAVLSIWRARPQNGRFLRGAHFGVFYDLVSRDLTVAQGLLAVLILRKVEDRRRVAAECGEIASAFFPFLPFATGHIAMLAGEGLLRELGIPLSAVNENKFPKAQATLEATFEKLLPASMRPSRPASGRGEEGL